MVHRLGNLDSGLVLGCQLRAWTTVQTDQWAEYRIGSGGPIQKKGIVLRPEKEFNFTTYESERNK